MEFTIRCARREELEQVNELRRQVSQMHVDGRPDIFKPGFGGALREHVYERFDAEDSDVIVAVADEMVCGFAMAQYVHRPESAYNLERSYCHIEEFGVSPAFRRQGIARALIDFCRGEAAKRGLSRIELDVWAFNEDALKFYEAVGFRTYRRMMELEL